MKIDIFTKAMGCTKLTYQNFSFLQVIHPKKKVSAEKKRIKKYVGNYVYENNVLKQFSHPEGYVVPNGTGGFNYVYSYVDQIGNIRLTYSDLDGNGSINANTEILKERNFYPFGLEHQGYNNVVNGVENNYKQFQGQEWTEDLGLNIHEWKYRISDPAIGRFWQIDPLAEDYYHNGTYNFSENRVVDAVELEGLEAFLIHGTTQTNSGTVFSNSAEKQLQRIGGNSYTDDRFSWNAPLSNNDTFDRALAAKNLSSHVINTRNELISNGTITKDEPITLIGYSHGGNVSIQAIDIISEKLGIKINLITVSTPAYETGESLNNAGLNGLEDPNKKSSINEHVHIVHENDKVGSFWAQGKRTYNASNSEGHKVRNQVIKNSDINLKGSIESHTKLPGHKNLPKQLEKIRKID